jgi:hypothetical protein
MSRSMWFVAVLLVSACSKDSKKAAPLPHEKPGPPSIDEVEPNNDLKSAQVLNGSAVIKASLAEGAKLDEDWYRIDAAKPLIVRFEAVPAAGLELELAVFDEHKNKVIHTTSAAEGGAVIPTMTCVTSCYAHVIGARKGAAGAYTLTVLTSAPTPRSEREPNNRYVDAQELPLGGAIDGFLAPADDQDWYKFTPNGMTSEQVISVTLTSPADVWPELVVARLSDQAPLATYRAVELGADIKLRDLAAPVPPETGYYFEVRSAWAGKNKRTSDAKAAYTIEAKVAPGAPDLEIEPNNDAAHATPIDPVKLKRVGYLAPKGDVDWYTFTTTQPSIIHAEITGVDNVRFVLSLIDPAKKGEEKNNEIAKADSGEVKEPQALAGIAVPAGENYLRVEGAYKKVGDKWVRDYENATDLYTLTLTVEPDDGSYEREPNDKPEKATPVAVGKQYKGFIQPAKDVDYYSLEIKEASSVAITLSAVPKLDLSISVLDANRTDSTGAHVLVGSVDKGRVEAEERLVVPFEPGTYLIEVREKGRETNAQKPYLLTLK